MNQKLKTFVLWGVLITLILLVIVMVQGKQGVKDVRFSEFQTDLDNDKITKVEIRGRTITYTRQTAAGEETVQTMGIDPDFEFTKALTAKKYPSNTKSPKKTDSGETSCLPGAR